MKLYIRKMQAEKKGLLSGHKGVAFKLYARIELPEEDKAIVEKYKLGDYAATPNKGQGASYPSHLLSIGSQPICHSGKITLVDHYRAR